MHAACYNDCSEKNSPRNDLFLYLFHQPASFTLIVIEQAVHYYEIKRWNVLTRKFVFVLIGIIVIALGLTLTSNRILFDNLFYI